jgi:hypothetical protein
MRIILASARGLLSGWLIAATLPLLADPQAVTAWTATGHGDRARFALAATELLGAALFAFESPVTAGCVLLMGSLVAAAVIHLHLHQLPWSLAPYALTALLLWLGTRRALRTSQRVSAS